MTLMEEIRYAHHIFVGKLEQKKSLGKDGVDATTILKWILNKYGGRKSTTSISTLDIGSSGELLNLSFILSHISGLSEL
jgi:hypothetical protein